MRELLKWYDDKAPDNSPWIDALAELRQRATREGSTSRRSPLRSTSTQRRRWGTATTFSTSPTASDSFAPARTSSLVLPNALSAVAFEHSIGRPCVGINDHSDENELGPPERAGLGGLVVDSGNSLGLKQVHDADPDQLG
jgi:hypothetical protein